MPPFHQTGFQNQTIGLWSPVRIASLGFLFPYVCTLDSTTANTGLYLYDYWDLINGVWVWLFAIILYVALPSITKQPNGWFPAETEKMGWAAAIGSAETGQRNRRPFKTAQGACPAVLVFFGSISVPYLL